MKSIKVQLPDSIERILRDKSERDGEAIAAGCRSRIIQYMLANGEIFECSVCVGYCDSKYEVGTTGVCAACAAEV